MPETAKMNIEDSEANETSDSSSSEEPRGHTNGRDDNDVPEYEKQRLLRISENKKRMEALGLANLASSFMDSGKKARKISKKGKMKVGDDKDADEDYKPGEDSSSAEDGDETDSWEEEHEDIRGGKVSGSRRTKEKNKGSKTKRKTSVEESSHLDYGDDDKALMQAIKLSLQDSAEFSDEPEQSAFHNVKRKNVKTQEATTMMKRKFTSRMQMTEDEVIMNFYCFDESWKGSISVSDIKRVAAAHDFTWSDEELRDMINCFDSDGDGKISLDDFRRIASRCNMIKEAIT